MSERRIGGEGLSISVKSFISVILILVSLIIVTGILTYIIPAGKFDRELIGGKEQIIQGSFHYLDVSRGYPIYKWPLAPILLLFSSDSFMVIVVSIMLLILSGAFTTIEATGGIKVLAVRLINRFSNRKYLLLWLISLFFMLISSLFGIFEEGLVLLPLMIILANSMRWDNKVALGMSLMASGVGFACALLNPFTIGLGSTVAGTNILYGIWYRLLIFVILWIVTSLFLCYLAKKTENKNIEVNKDASFMQLNENEQKNEKKIFKTYIIFFTIVLLVMIVSSAVPALNSYVMYFIGVVFLFGSIISGVVISHDWKKTIKAFLKGAQSLSPAILILLLAASVKYIATQGNIIDTVLYSLSESLRGINPFVGILAIYGIVLVIEFFITSASAKVLLIIPILMPLCELIGISKELALLAFVFGDGYTNMFFPTNPTLLVGLSISDTSYIEWTKKTGIFNLILLVMTSGFLLLGQYIGY